MAGEKVLIVDDDIDFSQLLQLDLKKRGYEVHHAPNGEDGLQKAQEWHPQLIVLDIKMPKMDGYTFIRRLKKDGATKDIPVIVMTSYEPMKDMFKLEGVEDYFVKSANVAEFLAIVEKSLKKP